MTPHRSTVKTVRMFMVLSSDEQSFAEAVGQPFGIENALGSPLVVVFQSAPTNALAIIKGIAKTGIPIPRLADRTDINEVRQIWFQFESRGTTGGANKFCTGCEKSRVMGMPKEGETVMGFGKIRL